jgi:hypothetical protein
MLVLLDMSHLEYCRIIITRSRDEEVSEINFVELVAQGP